MKEVGWGCSQILVCSYESPLRRLFVVLSEVRGSGLGEVEEVSDAESCVCVHFPRSSVGSAAKCLL